MIKAFETWYHRHIFLWGLARPQMGAYKRVLKNAFNAGRRAEAAKRIETVQGGGYWL